MVVNRVADERIATYGNCLTYQTPKRREQLVVGGENVNRAGTLDRIIGIVGVETGA